MEPISQLPETDPLIGQSDKYTFPDKPFESIGFALSGGGFRAASYGLGVLSLMNFIKTDRDKETTLLEKIKFVSSASGGTITLTMYMASLCAKMPFADFYKIVNDSACMPVEYDIRSQLHVVIIQFFYFQAVTIAVIHGILLIVKSFEL